MARAAKKIRDGIMRDPNNRPFFVFRHIANSGRVRAGLDAYLRERYPQLTRKRKGIRVIILSILD